MSGCWANQNGGFWRAEKAVTEAQYDLGKKYIINPSETAWDDYIDITTTPDGTLHLIFEENYDLWYAKKEVGSGWSTPVEIENNNNGSIFDRFIFPVGNDLYITAVTAIAGKLSAFWRSSDNGDTWSAAETIVGAAINVGSQLSGCQNSAGKALVAVSYTPDSSADHRIEVWEHTVGVGWALKSTPYPVSAGNLYPRVISMQTLPYNKIRLYTNEPTNNFNDDSASQEYISDDNGSTWTKTQMFPTEFNLNKWFPSGVASHTDKEMMALENSKRLSGNPTVTRYIWKKDGVIQTLTDFPHISYMDGWESGIFPCGNSYVVLYSEFNGSKYSLKVSLFNRQTQIFEAPYSIGEYEYIANPKVTSFGNTTYIAFEGDEYHPDGNYYAQVVVHEIKL